MFQNYKRKKEIKRVEVKMRKQSKHSQLFQDKPEA